MRRESGESGQKTGSTDQCRFVYDCRVASKTHAMRLAGAEDGLEVKAVTVVVIGEMSIHELLGKGEIVNRKTVKQDAKRGVAMETHLI